MLYLLLIKGVLLRETTIALFKIFVIILLVIEFVGSTELSHPNVK